MVVLEKYLELIVVYHSLLIYKVRCTHRDSNKTSFIFYLKDNKPYVQTRDCVCDLVWGPIEGNQCLKEVLEQNSKLEFAEVKDANKQEIKALHDFIQLNKLCSMKLVHVKQNLEAIEDRKWL